MVQAKLSIGVPLVMVFLYDRETALAMGSSGLGGDFNRRMDRDATATSWCMAYDGDLLVAEDLQKDIRCPRASAGPGSCRPCHDHRHACAMALLLTAL